MIDNEVKVWNRGRYEYREKFKGENIRIKPGEYHRMDYYEAEQFLGTFNPIVKDKGGRQDPRSYKALEIDSDDKKRYLDQSGDQPETVKMYACHACGKEFRSKNGLLKHVKTKHLEEMVDEEARDELIDDEDIGEEEDET